MTKEEKVNVVNQAIWYFENDGNLSLGYLACGNSYHCGNVGDSMYQFQYAGIDEDDYEIGHELLDKFIEEYEKQMSVYSDDSKKATIVALSRFEEENMEDIITEILLNIKCRPRVEYIIRCYADDDIRSKDNKLQKVVVNIKSIEHRPGEYVCCEDNISFYHVEIPTEDKPAMEFDEFKDMVEDVICKVYLDMTDNKESLKGAFAFILDMIPAFMKGLLVDEDVKSSIYWEADYIADDMDLGPVDFSVGARK